MYDDVKILVGLARGIACGSFSMFTAPSSAREADLETLGPVERVYYLKEEAEARAWREGSDIEDDDLFCGPEEPSWSAGEPDADPVEEWVREAAEFPGYIEVPF